ncbi:hypothetical protein AVEN_72896-1 [Araneus ventricosus]|uniref:Uncharacterized protein n=1 Tax=Araneus ventricosus TaxID=182803 RepID=A0A4Y2KLP0_ARAVE|nr:hypothetical protein AVEN_72896-1 [Araneus ventricosus]
MRSVRLAVLRSVSCCSLAFGLGVVRTFSSRLFADGIASLMWLTCRKARVDFHIAAMPPTLVAYVAPQLLLCLHHHTNVTPLLAFPGSYRAIYPCYDGDLPAFSPYIFAITMTKHRFAMIWWFWLVFWIAWFIRLDSNSRCTARVVIMVCLCSYAGTVLQQKQSLLSPFLRVAAMLSCLCRISLIA